MLYHWAKRRHRNKSKNWIAQKYWHKVGARNWVFREENIVLIMANDTPIVRHISLKLDINPILNENYFIQRKLKQHNIRRSAWSKTTVVQMQLFV
ncbi:MAG: hypothetical protein GX947_03200, partial [Tissierellia bacterium]|nr:hypothetical protein [Tissierellia bacterium]